MKTAAGFGRPRWSGGALHAATTSTAAGLHIWVVTVLHEHEDFYNTHRPHRTLNQAAPLRPLPDSVTDLDLYRFRTLRRACDLRFGRVGGLRQDRGSCLFVSCT